MININIVGLRKSLKKLEIIDVQTHNDKLNLDDLIEIKLISNEQKNNNLIKNEYEFKNKNVYTNNNVYNNNYIYDTNIEILVFEVFEVFKNDIYIKTFNHADGNIIFYNFIQPIKLGIKVKSNYINIERNIYIGGNFKIDKISDFEIEPIDLQVRVVNDAIFFSLSYSICTEKNTTEKVYEKKYSPQSEKYNLSKEILDFNYIDINKEFM